MSFWDRLVAFFLFSQSLIYYARYEKDLRWKRWILDKKIRQVSTFNVEFAVAVCRCPGRAKPSILGVPSPTQLVSLAASISFPPSLSDSSNDPKKKQNAP